MSKNKVKQLESELGVSIIEGDQKVGTLKDPMRETKNTFKRNQKQAEEFVNQIKNKKREFKSKQREIEKKELERYKKIESTRKENQEKRDEQAKLEKEKKKQELIEKKEREKMLRMQQDKEWKRLQSKIKTTKYMHEKLEEDYKEKVLMPELEKKKNELKEKREFLKPIDHKEIDQFQKKYEENYKKKLLEKKQEREKWYSDIGQDQYDPKKFNTKVYKKVLEEEKDSELLRNKEVEERKRKAEKMNNYARIVKEMHWPEVSSKKQREIENIKTLLNQRNQRRSAPPNKRFSARGSSEDRVGSDVESKGRMKKPNWNFNNPMVPKPKPKREPVIVDYLRELRNKREETDTHKKGTTGIDWDNLKDKNIDDKTKIELMKARTKLLEENAQRKEQMNKVNGSTVEDNVDINDMLIDAIEMKLSILDQIE
jgi:hypothetical protein